MSEYVSLLLALGAGIFIFARVRKQGTRAGIKPRRRTNWTGAIAAVLFLFLLVFAATYGRHLLAQWMYDTSAPSRDELRTARMLIFAPFAVPLLGLFAWIWWHERAAIRDGVRRARSRPKLVDPSRQNRLQVEEPGSGSAA